MVRRNVNHIKIGSDRNGWGILMNGFFMSSVEAGLYDKRLVFTTISSVAGQNRILQEEERKRCPVLSEVSEWTSFFEERAAVGFQRGQDTFHFPSGHFTGESSLSESVTVDRHVLARGCWCGHTLRSWGGCLFPAT